MIDKRKTHNVKNRILLVDDEETIRYALRESLICEGYDVDVARDAFQALECLKLSTYDLIITDIKMHGMDGLQLIREIKRSNFQSKIVIITAYGSLETVKEAAKLGVVDMISKPFKIQEIKDVIVRILSYLDNSKYFHKKKDDRLQAENNEQLPKPDNLLKPYGVSYYFNGPACQPKSTVVFDAFEISNHRSMLIFGNINSPDEHHKEWWENKQIGIMIKTLFRSKAGNSPKNTIDSINKFLYKNILPHIRVSILCVLIDKRKSVIHYINSGNNLVCLMITPNGDTEIMESNLSPLGISPRIDLTEGTLPYSYENRLMLSRSNLMSRIVEEGIMKKNKIENALENIKGLQGGRFKDVDSTISFVSENDVSFDDETILLISLGKDD